MMTLAQASLLIGTPYARGGASPGDGFDCFTLLEYVRRVHFGRATPHAGIPTARLSAVHAAALGIRRALGRASDQLPSPWVACEPVDGCAVGLARCKWGRLHHCGVYLDGHVLHAMDGVGVVLTPIERLWFIYSRVEFFECRN
jgi:hypothetical protein